MSTAARELAELDAGSWDALLESLDLADAYLRSDYVRSSTLLEPGRPSYLHLPGEEGDVVFACILREDPVDVVTPYGYGGPVAAGSHPPHEQFARLYEDWCRERGVVSSFVRFHPLHANHRHVSGAFRLERLADTVAWRLQEGNDLYESMHPDHRRLVRKARAAGLEVEIEPRPAGIEGFVRLYERTMERKGAEGFYFFSEEYWRSLAALEFLVRADVVLDGELLSSALFLATPPWLHYHLSSSSEQGHTLGAARLLLLEVAGWARGLGFETFHLGGGVGGRADSLHRFKQRFAPRGAVEAWIGKAVHDRGRYLALSGEDEPTFAGFFPAYRSRVETGEE
ncbi:MAG: GNAT family N-acetyltransferase [Gaiellaceae bacterium]